MSADLLRKAAEILRDPDRCNRPVYEDALADWLGEVAERAVRVEEWGVRVEQVDWSQRPLAVASLIVGEGA